MSNPKCAGKQAVLSAVYDRDVHTVALCAALNVNLPLGVCAAGERSELNPIDMLAMGLASCVLILMGKAAVAENVDIVGTRADANYTMDGYRIASLTVTVRPSRKFEMQVQTRLEEACKACPVYLAIHPSIQLNVSFNWPI